MENKRYFLMSSSGYDSIEENVIQHRIWWRGDGASNANDEIEQLAIKEGDIVIFFDTIDKKFRVIAETVSMPRRASELENFEDLKRNDKLGITEDRLVMSFKDAPKEISFEVNKEKFDELKELGVFGNTRSFETVGRYLQRKSRGRLTQHQEQEKEAFQYILKRAGESSEDESTINLNEDWQIFNNALRDFSEKFRKHPIDYIEVEEKAIQYLFYDFLKDKFGDWFELIGKEGCKVDVEWHEKPNRHDIVIFSNRTSEIISIACEIKRIWGDDINNLIYQMKTIENSVLADIQKLKKTVLSSVNGIIIKSGVALVFTNIKILDGRAILTEAANLLGITNSKVKLIIIGADGILTFEKN